MGKNCLIIRSAGENALRKVLDTIAEQFDSIDLLSNRDFTDERVRNVYTCFQIGKNEVKLTGEIGGAYDAVIILMDLGQYTLNSYRKFRLFAEKNWKTRRLYCYDHKKLRGYRDVLVFAFKIKLYRFTGAAIYALLAFLKPLRKIVICQVRTNRIGHQAANNEAFFRKIYLTGDKTFYFGFVQLTDSKVFISNHQHFKMLRRRMPIIKSIFLSNVVHGSRLKESEFYRDLAHYFTTTYECYEFDNAPSNLSWTKKEEQKGQRLLKGMGIDSWFVCFHARDPVYLKTYYAHLDSCFHDYRDCDIHNYLPAMEYITQQGGYAVRMGSLVEQPLNIEALRGNPRIIDYAVKHRSDFMDIWLSAHCKFFVGSTAGLMLVPTAFDVPLVSTNYASFSHMGISKRELILHKPIRDKKRNRLLTFKEIYGSDVHTFLRQENYDDNNLETVENTPEEILDITREMYQRLEGKRIYTEEDEELQRLYRETFRSLSKHYYPYTTRVGADFLRKNRHLLL